MTIDIEDNSEQRNFWSGEFGNEYIERNKKIEAVNELYEQQTGTTVEKIFNEFFYDIDKDSEILELGCNIGHKLSMLKKMGFKNLNGVEINKKAYNLAKENNPTINFTNSSIEDFQTDKEFDVVYTSGVLIHIEPETVKSVIKKMLSLTRKYIFGFEYFAENLEEIPYRGNVEKCWKQNYSKLFLDANPELVLIKEKKFKYKNENNIDVAYLLKI